MKYYAIALLIFLINVSVAATNEMGILYTEIHPQDDWFGNVDNNALANENYVQSSVSSTSTNFGFGEFAKGLWYFVKAIGLAIIGVPYVLAMFGLQSPYTYIFSLPIYLIYLVGIAQFVSNRALKTMS